MYGIKFPVYLKGVANLRKLAFMKSCKMLKEKAIENRGIKKALIPSRILESANHLSYAETVRYYLCIVFCGLLLGRFHVCFDSKIPPDTGM